MEYEGERYRGFTRRAAILAGGQFALLSALIGRMYYLQVVESDQYKMLAEENRISLRLIPPPRGRIYDRYGEPIATNHLQYRVSIIPEQTDDIAGTLDALARIFPLRPRQRKRILDQARHQRAFLPVTVSNKLTWQQFARVNVLAPGLAGVQPEVGQTRFYPYSETFAHVVGYVGAVSAGEKGEDPLLDLPEFRVGKSGIEKTFDLPLRGRAGNRRVEVNALGRVIREVAQRNGTPGEDLVLTLDSELQRRTVERLKGQSAAVVTLDAHSGEVLVLASTPGFDANAFNLGLSQTYWDSLLNNPKTPLINKPISGQYPPGSTFKLIVALAALEAGVIDPAETVFCRGYIDFGDNRFHCWKKRGHGRLAMSDAITQSCDVYFYQVARRTGIDRIADMARRFGLGHKFGFELDGEADGLVPDRAWKLKTQGVAWNPGETLITGIGQGSLLATPVQLAVMIARLANGGIAVTPRLVRNATWFAGEFATAPGPVGVSRASLDLVRKAAVRAVNTVHGTAFRARIRERGQHMGGKTGTAQVRRISQEERDEGLRKNKDKAWEERDHALFVGFAPTDTPRYAVAVVVEHGGGGASVAAPIARDVLTWTQKRDPSARPIFIPGNLDVATRETP